MKKLLKKEVEFEHPNAFVKRKWECQEERIFEGILVLIHSRDERDDVGGIYWILFFR